MPPASQYDGTAATATAVIETTVATAATATNAALATEVGDCAERAVLQGSFLSIGSGSVSNGLGRGASRGLRESNSQPRFSRNPTLHSFAAFYVASNKDDDDHFVERGSTGWKAQSSARARASSTLARISSQYAAQGNTAEPIGDPSHVQLMLSAYQLDMSSKFKLF